MSSLIGGRSGNRGRCAQPCRLPWNGKHLLNLKDMCTLDILPDILEAGVFSLKIEGRMKSPRYTAGVVSVYRKYLDHYLNHGRTGYQVDPEDRELLLELFDRGGFSEGCYRKHNGSDLIFTGDKPKFRVVDEARMKMIDDSYVLARRKEPICGYLRMYPGAPAVLLLEGCGAEVTVTGPDVMVAQRQPLTVSSVEQRFRKMGESPFFWKSLEIELGEDAFLPVGAMNQLRRDGAEALQREILSRYRRC